MKLYKVKPQYDGKYKNPRVHDDNIYIADELYTFKEIQKQNLNMEYMEEIELPYRNTYWCFGARFANTSV